MGQLDSQRVHPPTAMTGMFMATISRTAALITSDRGPPTDDSSHKSHPYTQSISLRPSRCVWMRCDITRLLKNINFPTQFKCRPRGVIMQYMHNSVPSGVVCCGDL
jgi:hypothetical protein